MKKLAPIGPDDRTRVSSSRASMVSGVSPVTVTMPSPPAFATAAANRGVAQLPIGACWIGTRHPTSSVNRVVSMADLLLRNVVWAAWPLYRPGEGLGRPRERVDRCGRIVFREVTRRVSGIGDGNWWWLSD